MAESNLNSKAENNNKAKIIIDKNDALSEATNPQATKNSVKEGDSSSKIDSSEPVFSQNPSQFGNKKGENIINSTINSPQNSELFEQKEGANFAKTLDPVSVIKGFTPTAEVERKISSEEDNLLFERLFPGVSRQNVENDEIFKVFARSIDKSAPFVAVYSDYLALVDKISAEAVKKHIIKEKNKLSSPGALASSEPVNADFFTKEQVLKMTREQISQNYSKIRKSQEKW